MPEVMGRDRLDAIMRRLEEAAVLDVGDLRDLQVHIDLLEGQGVLAGKSHHESHSTKNSHHTNHHTSKVDLPGMLETFGRELAE
jgi:hypothetical protein